MRFEETQQGVIIRIKASPKASKNEIVGWEGDELKVRIAAVPDKGKANDALLKFLSKYLGVSRSDLSLLSGETNRHKRVLITGRTVADLDSLILSPRSRL